MIHPRSLPGVLAVACISLISATGCRKPPPAEIVPTERAHVIKPAVAPGLAEPGPRKASFRTVRAGEVIRIVDRAAPTKWQGVVDGVTLQREGELLEVRRFGADGPVFVFASDLEERDVPDVAWVCQRLGNPSLRGTACAQGLRRTMLPGGRMIGFMPGMEPECPVVLLRGAALTRVNVPALIDLRVLRMSDLDVVLAWSRWMRGPDWTGGNLVLMVADTALRHIGQIALDETDSRNPTAVMNRLGKLEIEADGLRYEGSRTVIDSTNGREKSSEAFRERWRVTRDARLEQTRD